MTTQEVCTYNGKRYPRPEDGKMMYLSEAMARLRGVRHVISDKFPNCRIDIYTNQFGDHAPEGVEFLMLQGLGETLNIGFGESIKGYKVAKRDVSRHCVRLGLMIFPADSA